MLRIQPRLILAIVVTTVLVGALACSSDEDPTVAPVAVAPVAPTAIAAATAMQAAAVIADTGQRIEVPARVAPAAAVAATAVGDQHMNITLSSLSNWKPWREGGGNRPWIQWGGYMPPFVFDKNNQLVQGFATAFSVSEDGMVLTLHLNPDAVFQDGSPLTAASYKWALEFGARPEDQVGWGGSTLELKVVEGAEAASAGEKEDISGIVATDDHNLEFHLKQPTSFFPYSLSTWLQAIFKAEDAEKLGDDFFLNPIGAGPYTISVDADNSIISMTATDNWWEAAPIVQSLTVNFVADTQTRLLMFENSDTDMIYGKPSDYPAVHQPSHGLNRYLKSIPYGGLNAFVRLNTARPPFEDINVRKALAHAIDHDAVVQAVYGSSNLRGHSVLQPELNCYDPSYVGFDYDVEKAKQALAASSYKTGSAVPLLQIQSRPDSTQWNLTLQAWQQAWKDVLGIDFKIHLIEQGQEVPPDINMIRDSAGAHVIDSGFLMTFIIPSSAPGALWSNESLDAKLEAANAMPLTDPQRCELLQEVDSEFMDNYYIFPIAKVDSWFLVQPWVQGFETSAGNDISTLPFVKIGSRTR